MNREHEKVLGVKDSNMSQVTRNCVQKGAARVLLHMRFVLSGLAYVHVVCTWQTYLLQFEKTNPEVFCRMLVGEHPSRWAQSARWFPPVFLGLESVASRTTDPGREFGQCHGKKLIAEMNGNVVETCIECIDLWILFLILNLQLLHPKVFSGFAFFHLTKRWTRDNPMQSNMPKWSRDV